MPFQQSADLVTRDYVFPVGTAEEGVFNLCGTAFFVGGTGAAVTAAHIVFGFSSA